MSRSGRQRTCARVETNLPDHKSLKRIPPGNRRARDGADLRAAAKDAFAKIRAHAETLRVTAPEHLYLDEDSAITLLEMRSRLREHQRIMEKAGLKLGVVAVDYLQLAPAPRRRSDHSRRERLVRTLQLLRSGAGREK